MSTEQKWRSFLRTCFYFSWLCYHLSDSSSLRFSQPIIGSNPLDEKHYDGEFIQCKDGSKYFSRDRLNDNFCDCPDGTDEPGTSACPFGKFYCKNAGSTPKFLFSSRVNDGICDCCDGSDEYRGTVICPYTCVMGGNIVYQTVKYDKGDFDFSRKTKPWANTEELVQKAGFKALIFLQVVLVIFVVALRLFCKRKARRRMFR